MRTQCEPHLPVPRGSPSPCICNQCEGEAFNSRRKPCLMKHLLKPYNNSTNSTRQEVIRMANQHELDLLTQGREAWNAWRQQHPDVQPDFSHARLRGHVLAESTSMERASGRQISAAQTSPELP